MATSTEVWALCVTGVRRVRCEYPYGGDSEVQTRLNQTTWDEDRSYLDIFTSGTGRFYCVMEDSSYEVVGWAVGYSDSSMVASMSSFVAQATLLNKV